MRATSDTQATGPATITEREARQVEAANATGRAPVVFVHGLWLLPSSWDRWAALFEEAGFTALTPGWPDDPETVAEAHAHPEVFAQKTVGQVADHFDEIIRKLNKKPAIIGHSFGGLLVQILAGRGRAAATAHPGGETHPRALGYNERTKKAAEEHPRRARDHRDRQPRARPHHRQRVARGGQHGARVRAPVRQRLSARDRESCHAARYL